jgi:hypothetical protein
MERKGPRIETQRMPTFKKQEEEEQPKKILKRN